MADVTDPWSQIDQGTLVSPDFGLKTYQQGVQNIAAQNLAQVQRQALARAVQNPSPEAYRQVLLVIPEAHDAVKAAMDSLDEQGQRQTLQDLTATYGYLQSGQLDQAKAVIQRHIDAATKAGQDPANYQQMLGLIDSQPKTAQALTGALLAGAVGADKLATNQHMFGQEARESAGFPTDQRLKNAQADQAEAEAQAKLHPPPKTAVNNLTGQYYDENAAPPVTAPTSNNGALDGVVSQLLQSESGGVADAKNPKSSATGTGQFLNGTWVPLISQLHPELVAGKTPQEILELRKNPQLSAEATTAYAQQNAAALGSAGLPVNGATIAMAHKLGPGGAQAVLKAQQNTPLGQILPPDVIAANPQLAKMTAGQYGQQMARFGTAPLDTAPGDPTAAGEDYLRTLPPARANQIRAIANGDIPLPTATGRNSAIAQQIQQQVLQFDPNATSFNLQARAATRKSFTSGAASNEIKSLNTFAGHVDRLDHAIDNLQNTSLPWINGPAQWAGQTFGNTATQKAVNDFKTWAGLSANEVTKLTRGGEGSEGDIKYWRDRLNSANSPEALHQVTRDMVEAVQSRLDSLKNKYNEGMQTVDKPLPMVTANTLSVFNRIAGGGGGQTATGAPPAQAVQMLQANPALASAFDAKYGQGASQQFLRR